MVMNRTKAVAVMIQAVSPASNVLAGAACAKAASGFRARMTERKRPVAQAKLGVNGEEAERMFVLLFRFRTESRRQGTLRGSPNRPDPYECHAGALLQ